MLHKCQRNGCSFVTIFLLIQPSLDYSWKFHPAASLASENSLLVPVRLQLQALKYFMNTLYHQVLRRSIADSKSGLPDSS